MTNQNPRTTLLATATLSLMLVGCSEFAGSDLYKTDYTAIPPGDMTLGFSPEEVAAAYTTDMFLDVAWVHNPGGLNPDNLLWLEYIEIDTSSAAILEDERGARLIMAGDLTASIDYSTQRTVNSFLLEIAEWDGKAQWPVLYLELELLTEVEEALGGGPTRTTIEANIDFSETVALWVDFEEGSISELGQVKRIATR